MPMFPNARDRLPVTSSIFVDRMRHPCLALWSVPVSLPPHCVFFFFLFAHSRRRLCNQHIPISYRYTHTHTRTRMYVYDGGGYCIFCATWTTPDWQMRSAHYVQVTRARVPRDPLTVHPRPPVGRFIATAHTVQMYSCRCILDKDHSPIHCFSLLRRKKPQDRARDGWNRDVFPENPCIAGPGETVRLASDGSSQSAIVDASSMGCD